MRTDPNSQRFIARNMSNKRKREDESEARLARDNSGLARPTQEIVKYFEELRQHFDSLDDKEEQALLVANALNEAAGQELAVAADPGCSRVLEVLLPVAEPQQVAKFFRAVLNGDAGLLSLAARLDTPPPLVPSSCHLCRAEVTQHSITYLLSLQSFRGARARSSAEPTCKSNGSFCG